MILPTAWYDWGAREGEGGITSTLGTLYMFYILTCIDESYTP